MAIIETKNLTIIFDMPNNTRITVVEDINLSLEEGEFVAILGPSGAGKSTIVRAIAGLIKPTHGEVLYRGKLVEGVNPGVSMVFQTAALFPWLTVLENVEIGLKAKGIPPKERREKALKMIDLIGLDGFESAYPKELSGGMRQRVGFARALVVEPEVLLMDEPFSSLDVLTAENLRNDLLELWIEKRIPTKTILLITHSIEEAVYLTDRVIVLDKNPGRIKQEIYINIPHWRDRESEEFIRLVDRIYSIMMGKPVTAKPPKTERYGTPLPHVRVGAIAGFVELVAELERKEDIYKIAEDLNMDLADIQPVIEAAELLKFIDTTGGDISVTELGKVFAEADVLEKKEIFRKQLLANVPFIQQIVQVLQNKSNHRMPVEFFIELLETRFSTSEAQAQMEIAIDWGRYAELFAYDEDSKEVYLEEEGLETQKVVD
jgi:NitT/TauT family transport system ATP-binding protein